MVDIRVKTRETGATSVLGVRGRATLRTVTGGELEVVTGVSEAGFNPLDLLYSSLAACLVLSVKGAVIKLQMLDRFEGVEAIVTGEKAHDEPSRVESITATLNISGDYDESQRHEIATLAKHLCTISNTIAAAPPIQLQVNSAA